MGKDVIHSRDFDEKVSALLTQLYPEAQEVLKMSICNASSLRRTTHEL